MLKNTYIGIVVLLIGLYLLPQRVSEPSFDGIPGDICDTRFNNYVLEHGYKWMVGQEEYFWGAPFMYPEANVITLSDNLLGVMPIYAVFRMIGFDRETSLQLWFWAICILNFCAAYFVLKKWFRNDLAAACGAYLFAFSIPVVAQINHLQLVPRFCVPITLYYLFLFLQKGKFQHSIFVALLLVFQFYGSIYLGFFLLVVVAVSTGSYVIFSFKPILTLLRNKKAGLSVVLSCLLFSGLVYPLLSKYAVRAEELGMRRWEEIEPLLPRFSSFLFAGEHSLLWSWIIDPKDLPFFWEHVLFPGFVFFPITIAVIILIYKKKLLQEYRLFVLPVVFSFLIIGLLFISVNGYTLYSLLYHLPGFGAMRAPLRIQLILLFFIGVVLAYCIVHLQQNPRFKTFPVSLIIFSMVILDQSVKKEGLITYSKSEDRNRMQPLLNALENFDPEKHVAFIYMPDSTDHTVVQLDAMMCAQTKGIKTLNGYGSSAPQFFGEIWQCYYLDKSVRSWMTAKGHGYEIEQLFIVNKDGKVREDIISEH